MIRLAGEDAQGVCFPGWQPVGYYYGGEDVPAHTFEWKLPKGEVWFYAVANEQEAENCFAKTKETFLYCPVRQLGEYIRSKAWK